MEPPTKLIVCGLMQGHIASRSKTVEAVELITASSGSSLEVGIWCSWWDPSHSKAHTGMTWKMPRGWPAFKQMATISQNPAGCWSFTAQLSSVQCPAMADVIFRCAFAAVFEFSYCCFRMYSFWEKCVQREWGRPPRLCWYSTDQWHRDIFPCKNCARWSIGFVW